MTTSEPASAEDSCAMRRHCRSYIYTLRNDNGWMTTLTTDTDTESTDTDTILWLTCKLSRRDFVSTAAILTGGLTAGLPFGRATGCQPAEQQPVSSYFCHGFSLDGQ